MAAMLPGPISTYFTASNAHDIEGMLEPFADHATVKDEGTERHGRAAELTFRFTIEHDRIVRLEIG